MSRLVINLAGPWGERGGAATLTGTQTPATGTACDPIKAIRDVEYARRSLQGTMAAATGGLAATASVTAYSVWTLLVQFSSAITRSVARAHDDAGQAAARVWDGMGWKDAANTR
jgi:hypothetical protein